MNMNKRDDEKKDEMAFLKCGSFDEILELLREQPEGTITIVFQKKPSDMMPVVMIPDHITFRDAAVVVARGLESLATFDRRRDA